MTKNTKKQAYGENFKKMTTDHSVSVVTTDQKTPSNGTAITSQLMVQPVPRLRTVYNTFDLSDFTNEKLEYQRKLYEELKKKYSGKKKTFLSTISLDDPLIEILDAIRRKLLFQWNTRMIPVGGTRKEDEQIIKEFKHLLEILFHEVLRMGNDGIRDILHDFYNADAGLNQYFSEMMNTATVNGSVVDCLLEKNRKRFIDAYECKILNNSFVEITEKNFFDVFKQMCRISTTTQPVGNFPSLVAAKIIWDAYKHSLKANKGIPNDNFVVLDPASGFAGRMLGLLSIFQKLREDYFNIYRRELHVTYLTTDPNYFVHERFENIKNDWFQFIEPNDTSSFFNLEKEILGCETPYFLKYCKDTLKFYGLSGVNVALTSPPYFNREKYDGDQQSYKVYPTYPEWTTGFLKGMIKNVHELLLPGGRFYLNIADTLEPNGHVNPLESDSCKYFQECGMEKIITYKMLLKGSSKSKNRVRYGAYEYKFEPIFVYQKLSNKL